MMRHVLMACLVAVASVVAVQADAEDPLSWSVVRQWSASVMPTPTSWLLHRMRPAWTSSEPVLLTTDRNGAVTASGMSAEDIRAVGLWRDMVVAVRIVADGADILLIDSAMRVTAQSPLDRTATVGHDAVVSVYARNDVHWIFVRIDGIVMAIDPEERPLRPRILEDGVRGVTLLDSSASCLAMVHDVGGVAYVSVLDSTLHRRIAPSVPLAAWSRVEQANEHVVVLSPIDSEEGMQLTVVNIATSEARSVPVSSSVDLSDVTVTSEGLSLATLVQRNGRFEISLTPVSDIADGLRPGVVIPGDVGSPLALRCIADTIVLISTGGMIMVHHGAVISRDAATIVVDPSSLRVYRNGDDLLLSSTRGSMLFARSDQPFWFVMRAIKTVGAYVVPLTLLLVIGFLWYRLRTQRRFLDAMLELPGAGLVFVTDASGRLLRTNERSARLLRITKKVPMRRLFHAYLRHEGVDGVRDFLAQALTDRRPLSEKVAVDDGDEQREYVFTALPLFGSFGKLRGIVVTGIDITEALERRRLVNWAQLAHDMQTNLSTIRLNAEQLVHEESSRNQERVRRILFQTSVLIQRVRDLVSVGRSEDLTKAPVHSAEFCTQIRHEFDPDMFPHVTFAMKLRGCMMNVDKLKLSRAIRNAVENAIKSLRGKPGIVEIATWFDKTNVFIRVSDTGVGMDTLTLEQMMRPYFTTSKDGSGTGIGTMIMQHVTHLHKGSLRVTSEPGVGTQVVFMIPHEMDNVRVSRTAQYEGESV